MISALRFHLTRVSQNAKVGPLPVSTSSRATCPPTCPFLKNGCYADAGFYTRLHWDAVTRGDRGVPFAEFLDQVRNLPAGQLWRHGVAGDLVHTAGKISRRYVRALVAANKGRRGFTYTHHDPTKGENAALIRYANRNDFRVNVSTETEAAADRAIAAGMPAVLAVPSTETRTSWRTPAGNAVLVCPAQRSDTKTCSTCQLCENRGSRVVIAFIAHGTGKRKADQAILGAAK